MSLYVQEDDLQHKSHDHWLGVLLSPILSWLGERESGNPPKTFIYRIPAGNEPDGENYDYATGNTAWLPSSGTCVRDRAGHWCAEEEHFLRETEQEEGDWLWSPLVASVLQPHAAIRRLYMPGGKPARHPLVEWNEHYEVELEVKPHEFE